jgi:hypothetical protein
MLRFPFLVAVTALAAVIVGVPDARGQGGPPLITDDPGTPGPGKWEIQFSFAHERSQNERVYEAPLLDINYGVGERIQLKYEVAYLTVDDDKAGAHSGLGNSLAGFKYRFLDEDREGLSMSFYPQVEFNNPTKSARRGLVDSGTNVLLPVEVARRFGPFEVAAEVGYQFTQHQDDQWIYGVAAAYPLSEKLELLGEIHGLSDQDFGRNDLLCNVGTRWEFAEGLTLLLSVGRSLRDVDDDSPQLTVYAGIQFNF